MDVLSVLCIALLLALALTGAGVFAVLLVKLAFGRLSSTLEALDQPIDEGHDEAT